MTIQSQLRVHLSAYSGAFEHITVFAMKRGLEPLLFIYLFFLNIITKNVLKKKFTHHAEVVK